MRVNVCKQFAESASVDCNTCPILYAAAQLAACCELGANFDALHGGFFYRAVVVVVACSANWRQPSAVRIPPTLVQLISGDNGTADKSHPGTVGQWRCNSGIEPIGPLGRGP